MKEQLKRELNKTYLILSSGDEKYEESYEIEMLVKNKLETILPLHVLRMDGIAELYYEVSSKQTLKDCAERVKINAQTIRCLFETIDYMIGEMKDYLLEMECIVLRLDHIYTKDGKFYFCYCPWERKDVLNSFRGMLEEILGELDYHDTEGVELAYHLYQCACKGNFHISEILKMHEKHEKKEALVLQTEEQAVDAEVPEKEETVKKRPGILRRIIEFFLKKEEAPSLEIEENFPHEELYQEFFAEQNTGAGYTEVLEPVDTGTVLLENMPVGHWKLRPLLPGFEEFLVEGDSFLIGKKRDSVDGYIGRDTISRIHSRLFIHQERLFITDANSTNGTFVNGVLIEPGMDVEIFPGDRILFADVGYECYNSL